MAAIALARRDDQQRFRRFVAVLGLVLGAFGLIQMATGTRLVYWFWKPLQGRASFIFGPFINRDHFGFYMLMVTPIAFGVRRGGLPALPTARRLAVQPAPADGRAVQPGGPVA